jgi:predicted MPP superfamily phosphohydrolase
MSLDFRKTPRAIETGAAVEGRIPRRQFLRWSCAGAAGLAGSGTYGWFSTRLEVTTARRDLGLGSGRGLRVAALSDLHLRGRAEDYEPLLASLAAAAPDLLVVVGDTVDRAGNASLISILREVEAPLGKFATLGNWEHLRFSDLSLLEKTYGAAGVRLLVNEVVELPALGLVGLDDWREGRPDVALALERASRGPALVLSHCPIVFDLLVERLPPAAASTLAVLSGHTHGGQIAPLGLALVTPRGSGRYVAGWYQRRGAAMYVMRGIGYSGIPVRMGSRPEMLVLEIA